MSSKTAGMHAYKIPGWGPLIILYLSDEWDINVANCMELEGKYYPVEEEVVDTYRECSRRAEENQKLFLDALKSSHSILFNLFIKDARRLLENEVANVWQQEWTKVLGPKSRADSETLVEIAERTRTAFQMSEVCTYSWDKAWQSFEVCLSADDVVRQNLEGTSDKWWDIFKYERLEYFSMHYAGGYGQDVFRFKLERSLKGLSNLEKEMMVEFQITPGSFSQGPIRREVCDKFKAFLDSIEERLVSNRGEHGHSDLRGKLGELDRKLEKYKHEHAGLQKAWVIMILNLALRESHPEMVNDHLEDDEMETD